jgi:hypothetical protein
MNDNLFNEMIAGFVEAKKYRVLTEKSVRAGASPPTAFLG